MSTPEISFNNIVRAALELRRSLEIQSLLQILDACGKNLGPYLRELEARFEANRPAIENAARVLEEFNTPPTLSAQPEIRCRESIGFK